MFGVEQPYLIDTFLQRENTGFQYTPVDSIPTSSTCSAASQSPSSLNPPVVVANVRVAIRRSRRSNPGARTVATTVSRCTSNPAQQSINCSIASLPHRRVRTHLRVRGDAARVRSCHSQGV
jgi:hypothetical protein